MADGKEMKLRSSVIFEAFVSSTSTRNIRADLDQCYAAVVFRCGMRLVSSDFESSKIIND